MPNATSRGFRIAYVKESTFGTTPAIALKIIRTTGGGGRANYQSAESEELHLNETPDVIRLGAEGQGAINGEYSYGAIHDLLEGIMGSTWSSNVLTVGTTKTSFTIEDQYTDVGVYVPWKGSLIESLSINLQARQKLTFSARYRPGVIPTATASATAGTGAATAAPTNEIMNPVGHIQLLQEGGSGSIKLVSLAMNINRPSIDQPILGSLSPDGLDPANLSVAGSASMYLATGAIADKVMANTLTSWAMTLGGASSLKDAYLMSKVRLTNGGVQDVGRNGAVILQFDWQAIFDATNTTLKITRTP